MQFRALPQLTTCVSCILIAVVLTLLLSGCGSSTQVSGDPPPPAPTPTPTTGSTACPAVTLTMATGPTTGVAPFPAPAPVPPPPAGSTSAGSVCVSAPANGASVASPAHVMAAASLTNPIDHMRVYIDGVPTYFTFFNTVDALLFMDPGPHNLIIVATDKSGNDVSTSFQLTVTGTKGPTTVSDIQNMPSWEPCSKLFPPGHPRAGQVCASGTPDAVASMTEAQATPSLSGSSAKFTIGGPFGYALELWTRYFGGSTTTSHFTYDLYFMIDNPSAAQGLEFDVNQAFGNRRWVFGTECNFKGTGKWDVWDGTKNQWNATSVDCKPFPANTWIHLVWQFERVGEQVHYISLTLDDTTYPLDLYYNNQPNWTMEDVDVAFQMDGDALQHPYTVWLDKVSLTTW